MKLKVIQNTLKIEKMTYIFKFKIQPVKINTSFLHETMRIYAGHT